MTREEICAQIENHACSIAGVTYRFRVARAAVVIPNHDPAEAHAILEVQALAGEMPRALVAAQLRVNAPIASVENLPTLLKRAMEHWLAVTSARSVAVH